MKKIFLIMPILAGIMFGSAGFFVRTLTENGIDSMTLLFIRFSIAIIIMLLVIFANDKSLFKVDRSDIFPLIICGLCILGLNLFYNHSMNMVPLSLAAVLLSTAPVFVLIIAHFFLGEEITQIKVFCVLLVILGCVLATGIIEENIEPVPTIGIVFGLIAAIFWGSYSLISRKEIEVGKHTFTILFYSLITITIVTLPFTNFGQITHFVNINIFGNLIFLLLHSLFTFVLPYIFITMTLNKIDAGTVMILASGEPVAALAFGILIYNEIPSPLMVCGMFITIFAILLLSRKSSKESDKQIEN